jgi:hypothetical protein
VAVQLGLGTKLIQFIEIKGLIWTSRELGDQVGFCAEVEGRDWLFCHLNILHVLRALLEEELLNIVY